MLVPPVITATGIHIFEIRPDIQMIAIRNPTGKYYIIDRGLQQKKLIFQNPLRPLNNQLNFSRDELHEEIKGNRYCEGYDRKRTERENFPEETEDVFIPEETEDVFIPEETEDVFIPEETEDFNDPVILQESFQSNRMPWNQDPLFRNTSLQNIPMNPIYNRGYSRSLNPTVPPYNPTVPPYNPTVPPYNPTVPPYNPTVPPYNPTVPPYNPYRMQISLNDILNASLNNVEIKRHILPAQVIKNLPEEMVTDISVSKFTSDHNICSICQDQYLPNQKVIKLYCNHCFHSGCILQWFDNQNNCPLCNKIVEPPSEIKSFSSSVSRPQITRTNQPSAVQPSAVQPSAVQPSAVQPSAVQPSAVQPSAVQPSAVQPSAVQPSAVQPSAVQPSAVQPDQEDIDSLDQLEAIVAELSYDIGLFDRHEGSGRSNQQQ